jgi:hypothetical protein
MEAKISSGTVIYVVVATLALVGFVVMIKRLLSSFPSQFCRKGKCKPLETLPEEAQVRILDYFSSHEGRNPDVTSIFVCENCRTVFDDFSGEKRSRDADTPSYYADGEGKFKIGACRAFCKVCGGVVFGAELNNPKIHCNDCETQYAWRTHEKSSYRFLMPPSDAKLLPSCPNNHVEM